jgi:hypothetical protein
VTRLAWCPTRHGLLANSVREGGAVVLRDIMSWAVSQDEGEASVTERSLQPPVSGGNAIGGGSGGGGGSSAIGGLGGGGVALADFAWHPRRENTLLVLGSNGR